MRVKMPSYTRLFKLKKGTLAYLVDEHANKNTPFSRYVFKRVCHTYTRPAWVSNSLTETSMWITNQL
jgi:hypothetical protein